MTDKVTVSTLVSKLREARRKSNAEYEAIEDEIVELKKAIREGKKKPDDSPKPDPKPSDPPKPEPKPKSGGPGFFDDDDDEDEGDDD